MYHINKHETDFAYKEIFQDEVYFKHGITLGGNVCVFDVGANIGLFSLYIVLKYPTARVYAFEPAPSLLELLSYNVEPYGNNVTVYPCGLSDKNGEADFTYYPNYSIMSGFHAEPDADIETLSAGIRNQLRKEGPEDPHPNAELVRALSKTKLSGRKTITCKLRTVSSVLRDTSIDRIDLLKIDTEKSEPSVIAGIENEDWPRIKQIVAEVHSREATNVIARILQERGFRTVVDQDDQFANSQVANVYATRPK